MTIGELRAQRSTLLIEAETLTHKGHKAAARNHLARIEAIDTAIESALKRTREQEGRSFRRSPRPGIGDGHGLGLQSREQRKRKFTEAFRTYGLHGMAGMNEEQRALLTTSDATGGALIPQEFYPVLTEALKYYGPIATKVRQKVTDNNGAPIKVSLLNDTANGLTLLGTEGTSTPAETDPTMSSATLGVDTVSGGLVKISFQELSDSSFDLDSTIRDLFSMRYGRGIEKAITLGLDSAGTTLPNQASGGLVGVATVGTTTSTVAGGIGWGDLVSLYSALDPAYVNPNTAWVMNSTTHAYLIGLKDGFGR
jgi:HK97 family phage major capsid protein